MRIHLEMTHIPDDLEKVDVDGALAHGSSNTPRRTGLGECS
jgi:hypothetical protein